ncbi:MAG: EF-Tu/IF-2/RF-3 family GTPase, partial [Christensenellales bacterium]
DLFIELGAEEGQLDFPVLYASAKEGYAGPSHTVRGGDMRPLFEVILRDVPAPQGEMDQPFQILFSNIDYDPYVGRIGVGRVERGRVSVGQAAVLCKNDGSQQNIKIVRLYQFEGLERIERPEAAFGDIVAVAGIEDLNIGETACDPAKVEALPFVQIDEPTISMNFMVNDSPFAGREGKFVTSRNLRARLFKEVETNLSMRVEETDSSDTFKVSGRGELHLSILIETMRREGYEFQVSKAKVIFREEEGHRLEPMERLTIDVPENYVGVVMEKIGARKGELEDMSSNDQGGVRLVFSIPARGLMGYRSECLTDTKGNGVMSHVFAGYEPYKGDLVERQRGSIVAHEAGDTTGYGLFHTQERGKLFVGPGTAVYEGMIVGENAKADDLTVNVCRKKHVTNMRASGSDDALKLTPAIGLSLEQMMEFIKDDELVEVTPRSIRMRKRILNKDLRMKALKKTAE